MTNYGDDPIVLQLGAVGWTKVFGQDRHESTKDIVITPPMVNLGPQEKQIIRVGVTVPPDPKRGATYRLIFKEVPSPDSGPYFGIKTLLEVRVPLVIAPLVPSKPEVTWKIKKISDKKISVEIQNIGDSYISLHEISLSAKDEKRSFYREPVSSYILPSQKQEFELNLLSSMNKNNVEIKAETDQGEITATVPVVWY